MLVFTPINFIKIFENRFIPDSQGDTRQNHLKIIEHEAYYKEIYMFSMCPRPNVNIFHYFEHKSVIFAY